jgi:hypothetical protein
MIVPWSNRPSENARRGIAYVTISIEWLFFSQRQARAEPDNQIAI